MKTHNSLCLTALENRSLLAGNGHSEADNAPTFLEQAGNCFMWAVGEVAAFGIAMGTANLALKAHSQLAPHAELIQAKTGIDINTVPVAQVALPVMAAGVIMAQQAYKTATGGTAPWVMPILGAATGPMLDKILPPLFAAFCAKYIPSMGGVPHSGIKAD